MEMLLFSHKRNGPNVVATEQYIDNKQNIDNAADFYCANMSSFISYASL